MSLFRRTPAARPSRISRVASAAPARSEAPRLRKLSQAWQNTALGYYDTIGECWYPAQFYARAMPKVRFFPAILDERGDPQEVESGPLVDLLERVQDPGGGRSDLTGSYGRLMFLIGDGYLVVSEDGGEEAWEFLSPLELRVNAGDGGRQTYRRIRAPGIEAEELIEAADDDFEPMGDEARVYRLWRRHPAYSQWADSPVKAVLEQYGLLSRLTLAASAESTSRAATRGGFYLPDGINFANPDVEAGGDEDPDIDMFLKRLTDAMSFAISNPGSAAAMLPLIVRGPATLPTANGEIATKDAMGHFPIGPDRDYAEAVMAEKTIDRISFGLDMPRENVTGVGGLNHWSGWLVDETGFRQHIAPVVQKFCDDLGSAYLRPAAIREGIEDADRVVVGYDPTAAIAHPDEAKAAREGWRDGVTNAQFYRERIGATDRDAPDPEELALILALQGKTAPGDPNAAAAETAPQDGGTGGDTTKEPPVQPTEQDPAITASAATVMVTPTAAVAADLRAKIIGASEYATLRARSLACSRLVIRSKGCDECKERIKGVPPSLVAASLGPQEVRALIEGRMTEAELVKGPGAELARTISRWGVNDGWPDELGTLIEQHAVATLYESDPEPLPDGFEAVVARAVA